MIKKYLFIIILIAVVWFLFSNNYINLNFTGNAINNNLSHIGNNSIYPDPEYTPGDVLTTNSTIVCVKGYTATVRDVPTSLKKEVYQEYGISYPQPEGSYEVDHFIPLELGGSNDIKNLWPEAALPVPGFHEKDKVENYLHDQVCNHGLSLEEAQNEIKGDWYQVYLGMR